MAALLGLAAAATAEDEVPIPQEGPWRLILKNQLGAEKNCDLNEVLVYREIPLGDETAIEGRVSCIDGREFDFSRQRKHHKFKIELCEPTVC